MSTRCLARLSCAALLAALTSCSSNDAPQRVTPAEPKGSQPTKDSAPSSTAASTAKPPATVPVPIPPPAPGAGELTLTAEPGWLTEKPTSAMRKAQYRLPKFDKDTEDASLIVYFFGQGQGGTAEDNIKRWIGQFEQPGGGSSADALSRSQRKVNGMNVTEVELAGTYIAETSPGSGQRLHNEHWRMLAAIVDAKEGSYYPKLVGPEATVAHWEASFRKFVSALKQ